MMNLDFLNTSQKEAVLKTDGPVMILAGAGSGKTRTLVARIQYLIEEKGIGQNLNFDNLENAIFQSLESL
jgi:DNA helicase-2/ATP-dependent DNA helicase PcrA